MPSIEAIDHQVIQSPWEDSNEFQQVPHSRRRDRRRKAELVIERGTSSFQIRS